MTAVEIRRPEVPALVAAIANPMEWRKPFEDVGQVIVLELGAAKDLLDLIEDMCTAHRRCASCGDVVACLACGVGDLDTIDGWCLHLELCPACRFKGCEECRQNPGATC